MKRIMAFLLAAATLLCFASCGDGNTVTSSTAGGCTSNISSEADTSSDTASSGDSTQNGEYASAEKGVGNTTLSGIEVKDVDNDGVIRVACVGDSITAGSTDNYPKFLQQYLNTLGAENGKTYEVKNHGKGGAACRHIEEEVGDLNWGWGTVTDSNHDGKAYFYYDDIAYTSLNYTPDVVIVQMGTNDAQGSNWDNWDSYFKNDYYNYLVKPFKDKGALVVLSTPPFACNGMHDTNVNGPVHDREVQIAWDYGLPIVDTNRLMYGMNGYFADGLHGNAAGYAYMALNFYKYIFGGKTVSAEVTTKPNAKVTLTDKASGISHAAYTNAEGKVAFDFMEGDYEFDVEVTCEGFKRGTSALSIANGFGSANVELEVGDYIISLGATVTASSERETDGRVAADVVDGDTTSDSSRWENADGDDTPWIMVDLGKIYKADAVRVYWETARASKYNVQYSTDGENWQTVAMEIGTPGMHRTNFGGEKDVRYIRIQCLEKGSKYNYSIFEIEVLTQNKPE